MAKDRIKKDKKRKQRRERRVKKSTTSLDGLLSYLSRSEPTIAQQSDIKVSKERAGVDAYDTLHSIIKSQQLMSANYMANLERMAFKTEISEQLKKQGEAVDIQLKKQGEVVGSVVETAVEEIKRGYKKKTPQEKILERQSQIEWQLRRGEKKDPELIKKYEQDIQKYQGIIETRNLYIPPVESSPVSLLSKSKVAVGGVEPSSKMYISSAQPSDVTLPSQDPTSFLSREFLGKKLYEEWSSIILPKSNIEVVDKAKSAFQSTDNTSSSGSATLPKKK